MPARPGPRSRLLAPALAGLLLAVLAGGPAGAASAPRTADPSTLSSRVEALKADVARAAEQLSRGALAYEQATDRLAVLTQEQAGAQESLSDVRRDAAATRGRLHAMASAAYKGHVPSELWVLLAGSPRALGDLERLKRSVAHLGESQSTTLDDLGEQRARAERLVLDRERLRSEALAEKQSLVAQEAALRVEADALAAELARTAEALTRELEAEAARRERARAAEQARVLQRQQAEAAAARQRLLSPRAPVVPGGLPGLVPGLVPGGPACSPPDPAGQVNGFLSDRVLCPLQVGGGHRLRTDAAAAFNALNALRVAQTGSPLCVTDSYRSYAAQVDVFKRKPSLAAVPGTSQHGWGLALDLGCGAERFGTEMDRWLRANAGGYGWDHPSWADPGGSKPEPWHWEFVGA